MKNIDHYKYVISCMVVGSTNTYVNSAYHH